MTLMELVVTIAITGMMAVAGAATFASIIDHRKVIREAAVETEKAAALREMIRTWITAGNIQIQLGGGPRGMRTTARRSASPGVAAGVTAAAVTGDELTFTTTAMTPTPANSTRIRLFVDGDENTPEHGLTIEYQGSANSPLERRMLDSTIGAMLVEYLDARTGRWFAASQAATVQPFAVRMTFLPAENDSLAPLLQLPFIYRIGDVQQMRGRPR